ncbi:hypothetical protein [Tenacibaculum maritimum]|uniref:hypothetical protein n=1 Tax=Tenacibaculum maritimum TaxID=107401 RepID=UPI0012E6DAF7|nr:hypothetical protein [Tenacibaculum maritimum]CAA0157901.1 conserved hypothetical protein [Tenacibaculum maritimum]CAA0171189.1 conserved hypothetical protein [Tenacibaculum maritimum]CAA0206417.1 conserved hypothetical protein [Tenacibaculum maritimum]
MNKTLTNIKERILYLAEKEEDSKQVFFRKTGLNYGNFTGKAKKSDLKSQEIIKILTKYPHVDLFWLISGKRKNSPQDKKTTTSEIEKNYQELQSKYDKLRDKYEELSYKLVNCLEQQNKKESI